ncbi:2,3-bisphosphoglycerate-independent phosphoglycerate mutase [Halobacteriovorax sp. GB3]|uniref:2,3-bisphosphoglycerate-independent phosphoglycerate mutase n=1 Tax=Halobacteriovorax sp. GB3 TaxID=2719615 RepID=UPI002360E4E4|nr:2,3-bisphosphoglycerate-independent phosphoglycerate mutase [Halobacteriovorax sp. GB3]MDD0854237.1 2,3-bisphosphoglycerate-independent phosphoglycerate mutase [Halobacteriovorax sp. GB3]
MTTIKSISPKALLVILDGFGINSNETKNAIRDADTKFIDSLMKHYPYTTIEAGGVSVGLPKGVAGNSEVGHMNLGAGRPVRQDLVRINECIEMGKYNDRPLLKELIEKAKTGTKRIHLMGLLSDGGVHSHIDHIKETINALKNQDIEIFFHAFMDGRDTQKDVGEKYIHDLLTVDGFKFASMQGRSIGMDRDRRWEKIQSAYNMFTGKGELSSLSPAQYLKSEYEQGRYDEFIAPTLFNPDYAMKDGDSVFFLNFRPDRAIQITQAMNLPDFNEFQRDFIPSYFLCMTPYIPDDMELPILFDKEKISGGMTEYLSSLGKKQLKIAETEKYAHVTFFFNGGEKKPFKNEQHILIPSPKDVQTYDQKPEMSAPLVTEKLINAIDNESADFYLVNFANSDMVGHTGNYEAAVKAIEALDKSVEQLAKKCEEKNVTLLITADHGNSDQMVYPDGTPHTSHTGAPVPFLVVHKDLRDKEFKVTEGNHALKDVSPTVLYCMGINMPKTFEGINIFT